MTIFGIPIFPDQASTFAKDVDALYFFILATCAFFATAVSIAVVYFGIRYHRKHDGEIGARIEGSLPLSGRTKTEGVDIVCHLLQHRRRQ